VETVIRENYSHGSLYSAQLLAQLAPCSAQLLAHWFLVQCTIISAISSLHSVQLLAQWILAQCKIIIALAPCTVHNY